MRAGETIEAPTMGQRITCRNSAMSTGGELFRFDFWMRGDATAPLLHVHPRQEERLEITSGVARSISGGVERLLGSGETVVSAPGEPHTVGPAGPEAVEMLVEFRPALGFEPFVERFFALDRAGRLNAEGRGNPLRLAAAKPHEAEFFLARGPIAVQRAALQAMAWLGDRLPPDSQS